jgi:hypothetical protein
MATDVIGTSETARILGFSAERIRQLTKSGVIPCEASPLGNLYDRELIVRIAFWRHSGESWEKAVQSAVNKWPLEFKTN